MTSNIQVDITDATEFHCFRLVLYPNLKSACCDAPVEISASGEAFCSSCRKPLGEAPSRIEIMLHAASLVDLTHKLSVALCEWQRQTTEHLICQKTGLSPEEARERGLIACQPPDVIADACHDAGIELHNDYREVIEKLEATQ